MLLSSQISMRRVRLLMGKPASRSLIVREACGGICSSRRLCGSGEGCAVDSLAAVHVFSGVGGLQGCLKVCDDWSCSGLLVGFDGVARAFSVPETASAATDLHMISYLKAIPDGRTRRGVLRQLLGQLDQEGALIQADAFLHTHQAFFTGSISRGPTSS
ncbi:MAG: hypothetical protein ACOVNL_11020 [Prochlorococcaceae cyanobacterium]|jgi:hypothetical protein